MRNVRLSIIIAAASFLCGWPAQGQNIDSLETLLTQEIADTTRVNILTSIGESMRYSSSEKMYRYSTEAKNLASKIGYDKGLVKALYNLTTYFESYRNDDSVQYYFNTAINLAQSIDDEATYVSLRNAWGLYLVSKRRFDEAQEIFYSLLRIHEEAGSDFGQLRSFNNIGLVFMELRQYEEAINNFKKALVKTNPPHPVVLNNIGSCYGSLNEIDSAIHYIDWGIRRSREAENLHSLANGLQIKGDIYMSLSDYQKALELFLESEEIRSQVPNPAMQVADFTNIASLYAKLGEPQKGIGYGQKALNMTIDNKLDYKLENIYLALAENYEAANDHQNTALYYRKWGLEKDSSYTQSHTEELAELQTKYETEKKEQQIALQEAQIAEQQAQIQLNLILIIGLVLVVLLVIVVALLGRSRAKKQQELLLREAQLQLKEAQIESALSSQEQERKRFARDLHDGFGQFISVLNLNLKSLEKGNSNKEQIFESSAEVLDQMYRELKTICFNLMPETLIKQGVANGIREFSDRINATGNTIIEVDIFGLDERLEDIQEISLYRITQEWVNNILKYSDATKINIQLTKDESEITLMIEDNGAGFDRSLLTSGKGNGWKNLNSRTNLIKGELELDTTPGIKGNTLILNAPVNLEPKAVAPIY